MRRSQRGEAIVWCYQPGPEDIVRCARCGQSCMPFPVRDSRLCAACLRAVTTTWPDPLYRRTAELARTLLLQASDDPASRAVEALENMLGVERCELFLRGTPDGSLLRARPRPAAPEALADDVVHAVARLDAPLFLRDAADARTEALCARGWKAVVPLRVSDRTVGLLALGPKTQGEVFTEADRQLLALAGVALSVTLEQGRLSAEREGEGADPRLVSLGMVAAGTAHEVRNQLVPVKTLLDPLPEALLQVARFSPAATRSSPSNRNPPGSTHGSTAPATPQSRRVESAPAIQSIVPPKSPGRSNARRGGGARSPRPPRRRHGQPVTTARATAQRWSRAKDGAVERAVQHRVERRVSRVGPR